MRNFLKVASAAVVCFGLFVLPTLAQAQELTLRVEPGVAIPLTDPQAQRFGVGAAIAVKPELSLGSYLSVGPALSYMALPSNISGVVDNVDKRGSSLEQETCRILGAFY